MTLAAATPLANIQVLVVDDEVDSFGVSAIHLATKQGQRWRSAHRQRRLCSRLGSSSQMCWSADIGMPEMDGCTLLQRVRDWAAAISADEDSRLMPKAIALTAYASDADQQRILGAGFQRHLAKPVEPQALIAAIVDLL